MPYLHAGEEDTTTRWFVDRLSEQEAGHDGQVMRAWAQQVLSRLPAGAVHVFATSLEGCALAAVVAALRTDGPTSWSRLVLGRDVDRPEHRAVVVLEPGELGDGLAAVISEVLPGSLVLAGIARRQMQLVA